MKVQWIVETHGDPLGTVRRLIHTIWRQANLDGLLVPLADLQDPGMRPTLLEDPTRINEFNPFRPLMTVNEARLLPKLLSQHPHEKLGAVLRPCEMRALSEMVKANIFAANIFAANTYARGMIASREIVHQNLLTISIDCLGTYPPGDFQWRADRKGSSETLDGEAIQFARQGGIMSYRYRSACQVCSTPEAHGADINIGVLGLPVRQHILVGVRDETLAGRLELDKFADAPAAPEMLAQRERMLSRITERNNHTRERILKGLADILPRDVEALITQFIQCGDCQKCMSVCPACEGNFPQRDEDGRYAYKDILSWMISCSGCGMCEQTCPRHQPLSTIFSYIRQNLAEPGRRVGEPAAA